MKGIYEFYWPYNRGGDVEGTFVATTEQVASIIGKDVYFGEIRGKHSEVSGRIEEGEITLVTDDQEFIAKFEQILGEDWSTGINPLEYYDPEEDDSEDDEDEENEE